MNPLRSRRAFLREATVVAAGAVAAHPFERLGAAPAAPAGYPLGCFTRPFDQHDYRAALDAIAEAGFQHCGIMTAKGKNWVIINEDTTPEEAAHVGAEAKSRGLGVLSVYADWKTIEPMAKAVEVLRRLVDHGAACGSPSLMLGGTSDERIAAAYYRVIAECCSYAASQGIGLTIKPHGGLNATGPQCRKLIESVKAPNFRLWYDPGNIFYYSDGKLDPVEDSATVDGLVVGVSAKDFRPPKDVMVTPGDGRVDFARVLGRLRQGGFRSGPVLVETLASGDLKPVIAEARRARAFLEGLLEFKGTVVR
jgi:sugar phosphate isomerase/epimerase